jgi:hypothetical protein
MEKQNILIELAPDEAQSRKFRPARSLRDDRADQCVRVLRALIFVLRQFFAQLWIIFLRNVSQKHLEDFLRFTSRLPENPNIHS